MGCQAVEGKGQLPTLMCYYETEEQQKYCINLKNKFQHSKTIAFEIKQDDKFKITFKIASVEHVIQDELIYTDEERDKSLQKIYDLLK